MHRRRNPRTAASRRPGVPGGDSGFTLIELLVVMIIIGILAAIAIPVFLSQREKAKESAVKSDVSRLGKEFAAYYVDATGALTLSATGQLITISGGTPSATITTLAISKDTALAAVPVKGSTTDDWCVALKSASTGGRTFSFSAANGLKTGACP